MADSTRTRKRRDVPLSRIRSSLSNGSRLYLGDVDERGPWCRRLRDLISDACSDLSGELSSAQMALVRRSAMLQLQLEMMEARWAADNGEASAKSLELYQRTTGALRRVLESLGLERRPRDVTPSASREAELERLLNYVEDAEVSP